VDPAYSCRQDSRSSVPDVGRRVDVSQLVGAAEIAERLGLSHSQTVHLWRRRYPDFPEPVAKLRQALVWTWPDVARWARRTGRL
jgi:hypothetical protein